MTVRALAMTLAMLSAVAAARRPGAVDSGAGATDPDQREVCAVVPIGVWLD